MLIKVRNLGRIRHADLDWRPFTVFVGKNGTNKTWTAYAAFAAAQAFTTFARDVISKYEIDEVSARLVDDLWMKLLAVDDAEQAGALVGDTLSREAYFDAAGGNVIATVSGEDLSQWLGLAGETPVDASVSVEVGANENGFLTERLTVTSVEESGADSAIERIQVQVKGKSVMRRMALRRDILAAKRSPARDRLYRALLARFDDGAVLPAERMGLIGIRVGEISDSWRARYASSGPVQRFTNSLGERSMPYWRDSDLWSNAWFREQLDLIIGGRVRFDKTEQRRVEFCFEDRSIEIGAASSLAKSLGALQLVGPHRELPRNCLYVIDEPEMNAHPEAQFAIAELLSILVQSQNHVLITTHSPYILDHLNNLMEASRVPLERQRELASHYMLRDHRAFIDPEKVAVYHFGVDGKVDSIVDRQRNIIDTSSLGNAAATLDSIYNATLIAQQGVGEEER